MTQFAVAETEEDYEEARVLLREYRDGLGEALCFHRFEAHLRELERIYAPPGGAFFLLREEGRAAGCAGLRDLGAGACELKRLYVRPEFRGRGLGRRCVEEVARAARGMGHGALRLVTVSIMREAIALYRSMGFMEIPPYGEEPFEEGIYMELRLDGARE